MGVRIPTISCVMLIAWSMSAVAQTPPATIAEPPAGPSSGVIIGGQPPPARKYERCIEVEIGGDRSLGCLNQQLKREVDRANPSIVAPPLDARSPDVAVGLANSAAVREQYGPNYGRSVLPFRPQTPLPVPHR